MVHQELLASSCGSKCNLCLYVRFGSASADVLLACHHPRTFGNKAIQKLLSLNFPQKKAFCFEAPNNRDLGSSFVSCSNESNMNVQIRGDRLLLTGKLKRMALFSVSSWQAKCSV